MKKYFMLLAAAATVFAVSCNKAREVAPVTSPQEIDEDTTPMPILFGSTLTTSVQTKAAVTNWAATPERTLYIYGFETVKEGNNITLMLSDNDAPFINNVGAAAPTAGANSDRTAIVVNNPAQHTEDPLYDEPFYYLEETDYEFFAYFVDDAFLGTPAAYDLSLEEYNEAHPEAPMDQEAWDALAPDAPQRLSAAAANAEPVINPGTAANSVESVTLPIVITGTQDIMLAKTNKAADLEWAQQHPGAGLKPAPWNTNRFYSAYTARRSVNPNLVFEHQLSRFIFNVKKGGTVNGDDITITGLSVETYTAGTLTIVGEPTATAVLVGDEATPAAFEEGNVNQNLYLIPNADALPTYIPLCKDDGTPIVEADAIHPTANNVQLGESIMVFPGQDVYNFKLSLKQEGNTAGIPVQDMKINLKNLADPYVPYAQPGKQYTVNLIIYGAEKVDITVSLTDWADGGEIEIDPDADEPDTRADNDLAVQEGYAAQVINVNADGEDFAITNTNGAEFTWTCAEAGITLVPADTEGLYKVRVGDAVAAGEYVINLASAATNETKAGAAVINVTVTEP